MNDEILVSLPNKSQTDTTNKHLLAINKNLDSIAKSLEKISSFLAMNNLEITEDKNA